MATRISDSSGLSGQSLITYLKRRTPKREGQSNFIGLKRSEALADLPDPNKALNNILDKISIGETAERSLYGGPFKDLDWKVTDDFVVESIDKKFLSQLSGASIGGGSLGSTVSITPRIRIQDRIAFINSFYGEGSYTGLHSGFDAQLYKEPEPKHIGYVKFTFTAPDLDETGPATIVELKKPDGTTNLTASEILGSESAVVLSITEYQNPQGIVLNTQGTGLELKIQSPSTWTVDGATNLKSIQQSVGGSTNFSQLRFKIVRPYSKVYKPLWFTESPNDSAETSRPGSADDLDPSTTNRILRNESGNLLPYILKKYWYTRAYVESRWTAEEQYRLLIGASSFEDTIVQDSNMRWQQVPGKINNSRYNWGIRWDGYLRITPGTYTFNVQTNTSVKIDMAVGSSNTWQNVYNSDIAEFSFDTSNVSDQYKYFTGDNPATDWVGFVPITVRMFHGGPDRAQPENLPDPEPDLFIKTSPGGALWKSRISSPSSTHKSYADLLGTSFEPNIQKVSFDARPEWWKVSEGSPFIRANALSKTNTPLDGFIVNSFKSVLKSDAGIGLYGDGSGTYSSRPNMLIGEARYGISDPLGSNYTGIRIKPNLLGEGGRVNLAALPVNNAVYSDTTLLGPSDLGGSPNHLTAASGRVDARVVQLYLWENLTLPASGLSNKFYIVSDLNAVSASDDPTAYGLPAFSDLAWLSPISVKAVRLADDNPLTTGIKNFVAPLSLTVQKVTVGGFDLLAFVTTLPSILIGGAEKTEFNGKFIEYYTESESAFEYLRVDTGESASFSDVLKLTYDGSNNLTGLLSEIPQPASDRVVPFGFDFPQFSSGICYPPYTINNPYIEDIAVSDANLYVSPSGNYDVFWGNPGQTALQGNTLTITEKLEFQCYEDTVSNTLSVVTTVSGISVPSDSYTHRLKLELPVIGPYDEDMLEYIGNSEKLKDNYFAYVKL